MKHIVAGQIMHESSSLAKHPTEVENFRRTLIWFEKNDVFQLSEIGMRDYLTGIMEKGTELGMEIAPCFCTFASPSGVISASCFQTLMESIRTSQSTASAWLFTEPAYPRTNPT